MHSVFRPSEMQVGDHKAKGYLVRFFDSRSLAMDIDIRLPLFQQAVGILQDVSGEIIPDVKVIDQKVVDRKVIDQKGNDPGRNGDIAITLDKLVVGILNDIPSHLEDREVRKALVAIQE
jgi:hypothetical protein